MILRAAFGLAAFAAPSLVLGVTFSDDTSACLIVALRLTDACTIRRWTARSPPPVQRTTEIRYDNWFVELVLPSTGMETDSWPSARVWSWSRVKGAYREESGGILAPGVVAPADTASVAPRSLTVRTIAALATAALALSSCNNQGPDDQEWGCTKVACQDGYSIFLDHESSRFPNGQYLIRVTPAVGSPHECSFTIGSAPPECPSGKCISEQSCDDVFLFEFRNDDRILMLLPVIDSPVLVEVFVAGTLAITEDFTPAYEIFRPNGPDCPPECSIATNEVMVPIPPPPSARSRR